MAISSILGLLVTWKKPWQVTPQAQSVPVLSADCPQRCLPARGAPALTAMLDASANPLTKTTTLLPELQRMAVLRLTSLTTQTEHRQLEMKC